MLKYNIIDEGYKLRSSSFGGEKKSIPESQGTLKSPFEIPNTGETETHQKEFKADYFFRYHSSLSTTTTTPRHLDNNNNSTSELSPTKLCFPSIPQTYQLTNTLKFQPDIHRNHSTSGQKDYREVNSNFNHDFEDILTCCTDTTILEETFNLFSLSSERAYRMTKTYYDYEALEQLLEEKERDLELAAKIGKTLISRIKQLQVQNERLGEQISSSDETISQLKYELKCKEKLLQIYASDQDATPVPSPTESSTNMPSSFHFNHTTFSHQVTPTTTTATNSSRYGRFLKVLENKIDDLEKENKKLRIETQKLNETAVEYENRELELVDDFVQQFNDLNTKVQGLLNELEDRNDLYESQKNEIDDLAKELDLAKQDRKLASRGMEELQCKLILSENYQNELVKQILDMQNRYREAANLLHEIQENTKDSRILSCMDTAAVGDHFHAWSSRKPLNLQFSTVSEINNFEKSMDASATEDSIVSKLTPCCFQCSLAGSIIRLDESANSTNVLSDSGLSEGSASLTSSISENLIKNDCQHKRMHAEITEKCHPDNVHAFDSQQRSFENGTNLDQLPGAINSPCHASQMVKAKNPDFTFSTLKRNKTFDVLAKTSLMTPSDMPNLATLFDTTPITTAAICTNSNNKYLRNAPDISSCNLNQKHLVSTSLPTSPSDIAFINNAKAVTKLWSPAIGVSGHGGNKYKYLRRLRLVKTLDDSTSLSKWKDLAHQNRNLFPTFNNNQFDDDIIQKHNSSNLNGYAENQFLNVPPNLSTGLPDTTYLSSPPYREVLKLLNSGILNRSSIPFLSSSISMIDLSQMKNDSYLTDIWLKTHIKSKRQGFLRNNLSLKLKNYVHKEGSWLRLLQPGGCVIRRLNTPPHQAFFEPGDNRSDDFANNNKNHYNRSLGLASILAVSKKLQDPPLQEIYGRDSRVLQFSSLDKTTSKSTSSIDTLGTMDESQLDDMYAHGDDLKKEIHAFKRQGGFWSCKDKQITKNRFHRNFSSQEIFQISPATETLSRTINFKLYQANVCHIRKVLSDRYQENSMGGQGLNIFTPNNKDNNNPTLGCTLPNSTISPPSIIPTTCFPKFLSYKNNCTVD